jgi:hypothetical protein
MCQTTHTTELTPHTSLNTHAHTHGHTYAHAHTRSCHTHAGDPAVVASEAKKLGLDLSACHVHNPAVRAGRVCDVHV